MRYPNLWLSRFRGFFGFGQEEARQQGNREHGRAHNRRAGGHLLPHSWQPPGRGLHLLLASQRRADPSQGCEPAGARRAGFHMAGHRRFTEMEDIAFLVVPRGREEDRGRIDAVLEGFRDSCRRGGKSPEVVRVDHDG